MRKEFVKAVTLLILLFLGLVCFGEEREQPSDDGFLLGTHWGKAMLRIHWVLPKKEARDELLALPEASKIGIKASALDERAIAFPDQPAGGFFVRLGDEETMISEDGRFALTITDQSPKEGEIVNPGNGMVMATFSASSLVPAKAKPEPIIIDAAMFGECGMDDSNLAADPACQGLLVEQP